MDPTCTRWAVALITLLIGPTSRLLPTALADQPAIATHDVDFEADVIPLLREYCFACHGPDEQTKGIGLHQYAAAQDLLDNRGVSEKVLQAIKFGRMPPAGEPRPTEPQRRMLSAWLESVLQAIDCSGPSDPGRVTIRRLNRNEYNNTIRDLVGIDIRPAEDFPSDDVGEGFDNIADVLSLSPLLLEKYMDAAERIAAQAIVVPHPDGGPRQRREHEALVVEGEHSRNLEGDFWMYTSGSVAAHFEFPRAGTYLLRAIAGAQQAGPDLARLEFRLDGTAQKTIDVDAVPDEPQAYDLQLQVEQGQRKFTAAFVNDYYQPDDPDPANRDRNMMVRALEVIGPMDQPDSLPESHRRLIQASPEHAAELAAVAGENLAPFLRRAYRRDVADTEVATYVRLVELAVEQGASFERGMQVALSAILVSPHFLFRIEQDPPPADPPDVRQLNDYELATRLSYFLWSSLPDDELFELARQGTLHEQGVLRDQVRRMLADDKSAALVENFAGQWLNLRNLDHMTPDPSQFADFDEALRRSMRRETQLLFETIMREDGSVLDFLDARYTFVDGRLAEHYGIPDVQGDEFRKITLDDDRRRGVLTHASVLMLTSNPTRTSPVKRGKWILENILGTPPPDPPPDVPELEQTQQVAPQLSLKEQLAQHRDNESCAVCHREMDAFGLALENLDAFGRWRSEDGARQIDPTGELPDGTTISGPVELVELLMARKPEFLRTLADRLLTYALGRGLEYYDLCALDRIDRELAANEYRFSVLVNEIVNSEPFRFRRGNGEK